jgi:GNAT superfamily N-acetyltransferase
VDFLTSESDAQEVVDIVRDHLAGAREEHVLTVFSLVPERVIEAYESLGYQHAWTNILMARDLVTEDAALGNTAGVRSLGSDGDVDSINATAPDHRTTVEAVGDPYLHDYLIRDDGRVIAKAQIVTKPGEVAYVSDMFTAPTNRRRGYSRALMESLHRRARACGAERSILVPSLMAREIGLYQKYGYRETIPMVLLIPHRD